MKATFSVSAAIALVTLAVFTIGPAILHGSYMARWGTPQQQLAAAASIGDFPKQLGDWVAIAEGEPLSDRVQQELGLTGYANRLYRNRESQSVALLLLMVGQPGPLVRHPPDICYGNLANKQLGEEMIEVAGPAGQAESEFRVLSYAPNSQLREPFRVAYAFTNTDQWSVPSMPRITFGGEAALYKVQIQLTQPDVSGSESEGELEALLGDFVGAFEALRSSSTPSDS